jgi:dCTP deaminase
MILTGPEITKQVGTGAITISPFAAENVNPNSYNYRLGATILTPNDHLIDSRTNAKWHSHTLPTTGFKLLPNQLYLGSTLEKIGSAVYVPTLIGRSSLGRLGMFLTTSADLGNLGRAHRWTLEIKVVQALIIYPGMKVGQVCFWKPSGDFKDYYSPYVDANDPEPTIFERLVLGGEIPHDPDRFRD